MGESIQALYTVILSLALFVFIVVEGLLIYAIVRFRRKDDKLPPQVHGNTPMEIAWTVAPGVILAIIFIFSFQTLTSAKTIPESEMTIDITGKQFFWIFENKTEGITINSTKEPMAVPVGKVIKLNITSDNVIHSFFMPEFGFKLDAVPGHVNTTWIKVERSGTYRGQCAEFCGLGHANMLMTFVALEPAEYQKWVSEHKTPAKTT